MSSGCPRATLKWLLSLDLSLPIKQVRRDFSNGFLFAELFAKFFPSDVSLHSYDTGSSLARKKDNWRLLQKVFKVRCVCLCVCVCVCASPFDRDTYTYLSLNDDGIVIRPSCLTASRVSNASGIAAPVRPLASERN